MLLNVAAFVAVVGVLIFVHEAGHFFAAKASGVQVLRFSLGFGRPLLRWRRGETEYAICWIPLGGYVKMAGLEDEGAMGEIEGGKTDTPIDPTRAFDKQGLPARLFIIVAGVTMNAIFAFLVYSGLAYTGALDTDTIATTRVDTVVGTLPAAAAPLATLARGARITTVNHDSVRTWRELVTALASVPAPLRVTVEGRAEPLVLDLPADTTVRLATVRALRVFLEPVIASVASGSPGARVGLQPGDRILYAGIDTVRSWQDFAVTARANPGHAIALRVRRGDSTVAVTVTPRAEREVDPETQKVETVGRIGVGALQPTLPKPGFSRALALGAQETLSRAWDVLRFLGQFVTGRASVRELGGPILIGQVSGQAARIGFSYLLSVMAFLSINLAVLNLLPIPILDGGQVAFLLAEAVRGKPLSVPLRVRLTQIGFYILLAIMALALSNDVLRLFAH